MKLNLIFTIFVITCCCLLLGVGLVQAKKSGGTSHAQSFVSAPRSASLARSTPHPLAATGSSPLLLASSHAQQPVHLNQAQDRVIKKQNFQIKELLGVQPVSNNEIGLFACLSGQDLKQNYVEQLLLNPSVSGISVLIPWSEIEPKEEEYNWQPIDKLLSQAADADKMVILRISTCGVGDLDTPQWVFSAGAKSLPYDHEKLMPIFWDPIYLAKWSNFVKALGSKYDKNPFLHSVGITGGGVLGGTRVIPIFSPDGCTAINTAEERSQANELTAKLKNDFAMSPHQLVENLEYIASLFPSAFSTTRLNFAVNPPTPDRSGEDILDQISDYLVYRYGERIYLTRLNRDGSQHGFNDYRLLLKFKRDTFTGYQVCGDLSAEALKKLTRFALDDEVSFVEVPASLLLNKSTETQLVLNNLRSHLGYQLVAQKANVPLQIISGEPLKASFSFLNLGDAVPLRPCRSEDKDVPSSYKVALELDDENNKPVVISLHTPTVPTCQWDTGKEISWAQEFRTPHLQTGTYTVWLYLMDPDTRRRLNLLDTISDIKPVVADKIPIGSVNVISPPIHSAAGSSSKSTPH